GAPQLPARGIRIVPPELFILRSELVFLHAAAGIHGADLSASGPAAEAAVRLCPRIILRIAGDAGGSGWPLGIVEEAALRRRSGSREHCPLLLSVQRIVLLVES